MCPYETDFREGKTSPLHYLRHPLSWNRVYRDHSSHFTHDSISITSYVVLCSRIRTSTSVDDGKPCLRGVYQKLLGRKRDKV